MSGLRYCDTTEPHGGHEWYLRARPELCHGGGDYFYCQGVLDNHPVERGGLLALRGIHTDAIDQIDVRLHAIAVADRFADPTFAGLGEAR